MDRRIEMCAAVEAAKIATARIRQCIDERKSFLVEAGAGAGKTTSLSDALEYLLNRQKADLLRRGQRVACVTFTNVARDEILLKVDHHPVIYCDTIHAFCWSVIGKFQASLREELPSVGKWRARLADEGPIGNRSIDYSLGVASINQDHISISHDDILDLAARLMRRVKFRRALVGSFPIILVDEYQDTNTLIASALLNDILAQDKKVLIGFFGDHWQKIYGSGCGRVDHPSLEVIGKNANFRSAPAIVDVLNRLRPELPQAVHNYNVSGSVNVFHTNGWQGQRRSRDSFGHWEGDLPLEVGRQFLELTKARLAKDGWDFSPKVTKVLMLTHNVLSVEQQYKDLTSLFKHNEAYLKKEDPYVKFFIEIVEPMCAAYEEKKFGTMFSVAGVKRLAIQSRADKRRWSESMDKLFKLRLTDSIGAVLKHLSETQRPRLPEEVEIMEKRSSRMSHGLSEDVIADLERLSKMKLVDYRQMIALERFVEGHSPFSTKHGSKGREFENVLVVFGRGWNKYNFGRMLELHGTSDAMTDSSREFYEDNRNLFYVVCSRAKKRLALLFTQRLSDSAMIKLNELFQDCAVEDLTKI